MTDVLDDQLADLASVAREVARDGDADWRRWAELGWLALLVPERLGGAGADERAAAAVARELGWAARREPYVAAGVLVPTCLSSLPASPDVERLLTEVLDGGRLVVPAWQTERGSGEVPDQPPVRARHEDGAVHLAGTACWVPAAGADTFLVGAHDGAQLLLVRVDRTDPGVVVHRQRAADGTDWARLELAGVRAPASAVLGCGDPARYALRRAIDTAALIASAELLGLIERMSELTLGYLTSRQQFGRPIGGFQVLQHRAVDMWVQRRLAEAALDGALRRVTAADATETDRATAASGAKARASAAALTVANESVQLHGAIGFTDEYVLGRYVNRALVLAAWLGNARHHTRRHGLLVSP